MNITFLLDSVFYQIKDSVYLVVKYKDFEDYQRGMDVDIFTVDIYHLTTKISDCLNHLVNLYDFSLRINEIHENHIQLDLLDDDGLLLKFDVYSSLPRYKKLTIKESLFYLFFESFETRTRYYNDKQYNLKLPKLINELLIRYFEYLEYYQIRPDKIKHINFIERNLSSLSSEEFYEKLHLYTAMNQVFHPKPGKTNDSIIYHIKFLLVKMKSILKRLKRILRNHLLLIPNLIKGDNETRLYVIRSWMNNNLTMLFNPLPRKFQQVILSSRVKHLKRMKIKTTPAYMDSIINKLDIYYINLEQRQDRNKEVIVEFIKAGLVNYSRFSAIKNTNGALGCAMSHMTILENWTANSSKLLMVCEDDIKFNGSLEEFELMLSEFINDKQLDILCLSYNHFNEASYNEFFNLTSDTQTLACYVVKPHMKEILLDNFKLSVKLLEARIDSQYKVAIDHVWKVLQKKYNFVIPKKRFAFQRESFSDIEKRIVDYKV